MIISFNYVVVDHVQTVVHRLQIYQCNVKGTRLFLKVLFNSIGASWFWEVHV